MSNIESFWRAANDAPPVELQSSPEKIIPLLLAIPAYSEYAVIGWYFGGLINEWRMNNSPSRQHPRYWMPCPKAMGFDKQPEEIDDESRCEVREDDRCERRATQSIFEPFTPRSFEIRCCDECAEDLISLGYLGERR
jgi:hypothetical protein